jgi:hypothetical protein
VTQNFAALRDTMRFCRIAVFSSFCMRGRSPSEMLSGCPALCVASPEVYG